MPLPDLTLIREFKRLAETVLPGRTGRFLAQAAELAAERRAGSDYNAMVRAVAAALVELEQTRA